MNVADYIRNKNKETEKKQAKPNEDTPKSPQEALNKYSHYSEEQLMSELFRLGSLSNGRISAKELDDFYANVRSFLTPEQSERMRELITQLKNS